MHEAVVDAFVEKLAAEASALKLGHGLDAGTGIGPLIDEAATFKCQERVKGAVSMGAAVVCGGNKLSGPGSFFEPTVVKNVALDSELWQLETFGPVAGCVEIKILRRLRAESPRRPPRHRRDACSMAWRCRFLAARPSQKKPHHRREVT